MTPHDRFRLGFLARCAEEGCSAEEVRRRVKQASFGMSDFVNAVKGLSSAAAVPIVTPAKYGLLAAALGGPMIGYTAAKMQERDVDPEIAKQQELAAALTLQAEQARRRASMRNYRRPIPQAASFLTRE